MRAAVFETFGEPAQVLTFKDLPAPQLQAGEVRVRMLASPINPSDLMTIRGIYGIRPRLPAVPGYEGVGIVEESRAGLFGSYLRGKRVAVLNSSTGNWQEQVCVSVKSVIPVPAALSLEQAATFFINPATAWIMTRKVLAIPRGGWLLQSAAGSAVGKMVIRLGQQHGFRTVNLVRRPEQAEELKALGADQVLPFSPETTTAEELSAQVRGICGSDGVPFAIDPVGGATGSAMLHCLGLRGRMLVYGTLAAEPLQFSSRVLMTQGASLEGFWLSRYMVRQSLLAKLGLIGELSRGLKAGRLSSEIAATFGLQDVAEAVLAAEKVGKDGKVLLSISPS